MDLEDITNKIKKEIDVLKGEDTKDKLYESENTFPDEQAARAAFQQARDKLFYVNGWSNLPGINSTFEVYESDGRPTDGRQLAVGQFIRISIPGPTPENWVQVSDIREGADEAEFTVHPSPAPRPLTDNPNEVKHFFIREASSTFRVERQGNTLKAYEIGKNEGINNHGEEAGDRALINTLIAEGGWAAFQALQWHKLTRYLVHLEEAEG